MRERQRHTEREREIEGGRQRHNEIVMEMQRERTFIG